jgi:acyl dehydratase
VKRLKFIDLNVGDVISFERILLDDDIQMFVKLSGDENPLHIDKDYGEMSIFGNNIVHGMLLASLFSKVVGMYLGENIIYLSQTLEFRKPAFVGDHIVIEGLVRSKSDSTKIIVLETTIKKEKEIIINGEAKVQYLS